MPIAWKPAALALALLVPPTPVPTVPVPDVPFGGTPPAVVDAMLTLAGVGKSDVVFDLGCGDGRIVIEAARRFGARGVGVEIDGLLVAKARRAAAAAGVADRVSFREEDFFRTDLSDATVVALFLSSNVNLKLRPKLLAELPPGARIVSHLWDMGALSPEKVIHVTADGETRPVFLWRVPAKP